ncbi:MAG TPA: 2-amino-4-hydroxy-6-hydroxymethyldihydropteridine diphosphokinase [Candidatus Polarisedimenticolia bacterium]|nr:2-amino-4-hydroxy-6-hydroxymethyldihydropteridine diphosphokinase [Candidatus Polarisedimenticolia bacterium]
MARAFISIGSNIDPETNVRSAILRLALATRVTAISTVYRTEPVGPPGRQWFFNCVVEIQTDLAPWDLKFRLLRRIEGELGRTRGSDKFAARTVDLDLILYDELVTTTTDLALPDPDIPQRPFLAIPLHELAPGLILPGSGLRIQEAAASLSPNTMTPLSAFTERLRKEFLHERKQ